MAQLAHLPLQRVEPERPRKKTGYGRPPSREYSQHGPMLQRQLDETVRRFQTRRPPTGVNPRLILRVQLNEKAGVDEEAWERCGFTLLSVDQNKTLVLFPSDEELSDFKRRLGEYAGGPPREAQKNAPHTAIFACIDEIGDVRPEDRIGRLLRLQGISTPESFPSHQTFTLDVELWDLGRRDLNEAALREIQSWITSQGGRVTDTYIGESVVLFRVTCLGGVVQAILQVDSVAVVDLPPQPTLTISEMLDAGIEDIGPIPAPKENAPAIGVLDSGVTSAHPLLAPAIGEATTVPRGLGNGTDEHGHGTMVSGLALYGDVAGCIQARSFVPELKLYSARVLNSRCRFDDEQLITTQMRDAIRYFAETYRCRVFNVSLGDERQPYKGGKVSPWASVLDTLARELDVIIIVSAGNYRHDSISGVSADSLVQEYPRYLLHEEARVIEPATGAVVLTIGALARSAGIPPGSAANSVSFRPIAQPGQPSPFTRSGPGLGGSIKPELCDYGGNFAYDGLLGGVRDNLRECSVVSLNRLYLQRLFTTGNGTSYAAPRVAHVAARLFDLFPAASANLIRALLVASASVPEAAKEALSGISNDAILRVCGYGRPDYDRAGTSDDNRVVLYADTEIDHDKFHLYEVPIPAEFIGTRGERKISVTLAFDPPVRHSRFDYLGVKMSFRLIRGQNLQNVVEAFRHRERHEDTVGRLSSTRYDCRMLPGPQSREGSTLQKATFSMQRTPSADYGDTYYLVVRCERKWARDEHAPQRYAVVVSVEHTQRLDLYSRIRQRVQARVRVLR